MLKEALIHSSEYDERQLRQDRLTGLGLLRKAGEKKLITQSYEAARKVLDHRNLIMHQDISDRNLILNRAIENIAALGSTLQELGRVLNTQ